MKYQERIAHYEKCWSSSRYWQIYNKATGSLIKETSRAWEVAEFNPDKVTVKSRRYHD